MVLHHSIHPPPPWLWSALGVQQYTIKRYINASCGQVVGNGLHKYSSTQIKIKYAFDQYCYISITVYLVICKCKQATHIRRSLKSLHSTGEQWALEDNAGAKTDGDAAFKLWDNLIEARTSEGYRNFTHKLYKRNKVLWGTTNLFDTLWQQTFNNK